MPYKREENCSPIGELCQKHVLHLDLDFHRQKNDWVSEKIDHKASGELYAVGDGGMKMKSNKGWVGF